MPSALRALSQPSGTLAPRLFNGPRPKLWGYNMSFQTFLREDRAFIQFITSRKFLLFALLLGGVHLIFMGYEGWLNPAGWHGGLPPVSLVAFTFGTIGYVINLFGRK